MDPNYAMAKFRLESKDILKSKHRDCWYYTKYFFFFLSIIQFLIILGLVLFMLFGNAHVGTEVRLKSVETRFNAVETERDMLSRNYSQLKTKFSNLEKQYSNCSNLLITALGQLKNRTVCAKFTVPSTVPNVCAPYQMALDRLNTSCIIEILQKKHDLLILQTNYGGLKEKCDQTSTALTSKFNMTMSEVEKLQDVKKSLETQITNLQHACTNINDRFQTELDHMRNRLESSISSHESSQSSRCWPITGDIKNTVDQSVNKLKQVVNNVMFENSQLKTESSQMTDKFQKCSEEKMVLIAEKSRLSLMTGGLEKQLYEKKEELAKTHSKYMKKEEDLEACRKPIVRMPFSRT